jgi:hypothetical protein
MLGGAKPRMEFIVRYFVGLSCAAALSLGLAAPASAQSTPSCTITNDSTGVYTFTVKKDGGPCKVTEMRKGAWLTSQVLTPPQHGTGTVEISGSAAVFTYTPAKGYVGNDLFRAEVAATRPFPHRFNIVVTP